MKLTNAPPTGATAFGSHFHSEWDKCQKKFWFSRLAPHPTIEGGKGLSVGWAEAPLELGKAVHTGLEHYLLSGATDGAYDITKAAREAELAFARDRQKWRSSEAYDETLIQLRKLLWGYDDFYGPTGTNKDFPEYRIHCDAEGPVVEREFTIDLGPGFHPFTCRVDALVWHRNWLWVYEHKTTAASRASALQSEMRTNIQGSGECFVLKKLFPDLPIQGIMLNVLVKDRGAKSKLPAFFRDPIARTEGQLAVFEHSLKLRLTAMQRAEEVYIRALEDCGDPWEAGSRAYIQSGTANGQCMAYNRACPYLELCAGAGSEQMFAAGFDARTTPQSPEAKEDLAAAEA